jgi:hypothetical protein
VLLSVRLRIDLGCPMGYLYPCNTDVGGGCPFLTSLPPESFLVPSPLPPPFFSFILSSFSRSFASFLSFLSPLSFLPVPPLPRRRSSIPIIFLSHLPSRIPTHIKFHSSLIPLRFLIHRTVHPWSRNSTPGNTKCPRHNHRRTSFPSISHYY